MSLDLVKLMKSVEVLKQAYNAHRLSIAACPVCRALAQDFLRHSEQEADADHAALSLHLR